MFGEVARPTRGYSPPKILALTLRTACVVAESQPLCLSRQKTILRTFPLAQNRLK